MSKAHTLELADIRSLEQLRDELKLQAHLFKADARERWIELEQQWDRLQDELKPVRGAAEGAARDISAAAANLFDTFRDSYDKLRKSLPR